ncbi:MAG TPA: GNAT family protein [Opitutaceae bacterium]|jgi:ribosomal-protein-alanine N-acetyltransferase|nr:GNAT family protein [Opitutaceae bacterium]
MKKELDQSSPTRASRRVHIRPPVPGDGAAFLEAVRRSRSLHRHWILPKPTTADAFMTYINRFSTGTHHGFFVVLCETNEIVGVINLNNVLLDAHQSASLGYYAFLPHAGQGLMSEGLQLVIQHAFTKLKLHRLEANIQPENLVSIALVRKCGFRREGLARGSVKIRGRWRDHERWAILSSDLKKNRVYHVV